MDARRACVDDGGGGRVRHARGREDEHRRHYGRAPARDPIFHCSSLCRSPKKLTGFFGCLANLLRPVHGTPRHGMPQGRGARDFTSEQFRREIAHPAPHGGRVAGSRSAQGGWRLGPVVGADVPGGPPSARDVRLWLGTGSVAWRGCGRDKRGPPVRGRAISLRNRSAGLICGVSAREVPAPPSARGVRLWLGTGAAARRGCGRDKRGPPAADTSEQARRGTSEEARPQIPLPFSPQ